jgi:bifunctional ADP-heptose synthase (sugar kinase/adenylyltransferase)
MIVATSDLPDLAGQVTMVSGGFDPLHSGHVAYFRAASELGMPVLCNVSSDDWVSRKHAPLLLREERLQLIDAIRFVAYTHAEETTTGQVLAQLRPRYFAKGADWRDRLPDNEREVCERHGVEIVFLDTAFDSSTDVLRRYHERVAGLTQ